MQTAHRLAFLLDGIQACEIMADEFLAAAGGQDARIALLLQGGERTRQYLPTYTEPWERRGVHKVDLVVPGPDGNLDFHQTTTILQTASGICIGGGQTPTYHHLYASEPISSLIRERHSQGAPFAGLSAGALLAMEICYFPAEEVADQTLHIVSGLNLVKNLVIGVHFPKLAASPELVEVMAHTKTSHGLGTGDSACAVFDRGSFSGILG